jgi:phage FluMu gp28-like protein
MGETPAVLLPYQQRWNAEPAAVAIAEKSRRVGLSWGEAAETVLEAAKHKGMDGWYIGYSHDMAAEFIRDCATWAQNFQLAASKVRDLYVDEQCDEVLVPDEKSIKSYQITFASGKRVTALSSRPAGLRGKQGRVIIDEAAFHQDLAGLLKAAMALLMWGGKLRIISTHNGDENPFNQLINECRNGKKPYVVHRITLQNALDDGLYQRICLVTSQVWTPEAQAQWEKELRANYGDDADEELDVIPKSGGGTYLDGATIRRAMTPDVPVLRLTLPAAFAMRDEGERKAVMRDWCEEHLQALLLALPQHARHFLGEDFGRTGDLSTLCPLTEQQNLHLRAPFLLELRNVPFEAQKQLVFYIIDRLPRFTHGAFDSTGNGAYLGEVTAQRYGVSRITQVKLSDSYYLTACPKLKRAFDDGLLTLPQDTDVLQDLKALKLIKGIAKLADDARRRAACDGQPRHGDAAIAILLATAAALSDAGPAVGSMQSVDARTYAAPRRRLI